jgi:hypothetical protein
VTALVVGLAVEDERTGLADGRGGVGLAGAEAAGVDAEFIDIHGVGGAGPAVEEGETELVADLGFDPAVAHGLVLEVEVADRDLAQCRPGGHAEHSAGGQRQQREGEPPSHAP